MDLIAVVRAIVASEIEGYDWLAIWLKFTQITRQILELVEIEFELFAILFFALSFITEFQPDCDFKVIDHIEFLHKLFIISQSFFRKIKSRIKSVANRLC